MRTNGAWPHGDQLNENIGKSVSLFQQCFGGVRSHSAGFVRIAEQHQILRYFGITIADHIAHRVPYTPCTKEVPSLRVNHIRLGVPVSDSGYYRWSSPYDLPVAMRKLKKKKLKKFCLYAAYALLIIRYLSRSSMQRTSGWVTRAEKLFRNLRP